jgi:hypothetical protein
VNPHKGDVAFEAGGRSYTLRFSTNAIVVMEDHFDRGVNEISALLSDPGKLRIGHVRAVFWAGLSDHHAAFTLQEAGAIIDAIGQARAVELIALAFSRAFPEAEAQANPPAPGQADGTGPA